MRIGDLAARSGVSVRSLRYYEEQDLLHSDRSSSGQRHYDERAVERVGMIQMFFAAGLSSKTIQGLMPCMLTGLVTDQTRNLLLAERDRIDQQMAALAAARSKLVELVEYVYDPAPPVCTPMAEPEKTNAA